MMNRKQKLINTTYIYIAAIVIWITIITIACIHGIIITFDPIEVHSYRAKEGAKYGFTAIDSADLSTEGENYKLILMNEKKQLIKVIIKNEETKNKLVNVSEKNPQKFIGVVHKEDISKEEREFYFGLLKGMYFEDAKKLYSYSLIEEPVNINDYSGAPVIALIGLINFAFMAYIIFNSGKKSKKAINFFKNNKYCNEAPATFSITKTIEVLKDYLFILNRMPSVIHINSCREFRVVKGKLGFIFHYYVIIYKDKEGNERKDFLGQLSKKELNQIKDYIVSYGKYSSMYINQSF